MKLQSIATLLLYSFCSSIATISFVPQTQASGYRDAIIQAEMRRNTPDQYNQYSVPPSFEQRFICRIQSRIQQAPVSEHAYRRILIRLSQRFNHSIEKMHILLHDTKPCVTLQKTADSTPSSYQDIHHNNYKQMDIPVAKNKQRDIKKSYTNTALHTGPTFVDTYKKKSTMSSKSSMLSNIQHVKDRSNSASSSTTERGTPTSVNQDATSTSAQLRILCLVQKRIHRKTQHSQKQQKTYANILSERWHISESAIIELLQNKELCNATDAMEKFLQNAQGNSASLNNNNINNGEIGKKGGMDQHDSEHISQKIASLPSILLLVGGMMIGAFILLIVLIVSILLHPQQEQNTEE